MKNSLVATTAAFFVAGLAHGAVAQNLGGATVVAEIDWAKTVSVVERIAVEKALFVAARPSFTLDRNASEGFLSAAVGNARGSFNAGVEGDQGNSHEALIASAVHDNAGLINVNADSGVMNNQGNMLALGETESAMAAADAQADVAQRNAGNDLTDVGSAFYDDQGALAFRVRRTATLTNAVYGETGITALNQASGVMDNQTNAMTMAAALGVGGVTALSEAALGQTTQGNNGLASNVRYEDRASAAVHGNAGVTQVNQTSGNLNNQASTIAFSGLLSVVPPSEAARSSNLNLSKSDCCRY